MNGTVEALLPAHELVLGGGAPQYDRDVKQPAYLNKIKAFDIASVKRRNDIKKLRKN